jgi:hypothetical protein
MDDPATASAGSADQVAANPSGDISGWYELAPEFVRLPWLGQYVVTYTATLKGEAAVQREQTACFLVEVTRADLNRRRWHDVHYNNSHSDPYPNYRQGTPQRVHVTVDFVGKAARQSVPAYQQVDCGVGSGAQRVLDVTKDLGRRWYGRAGAFIVPLIIDGKARTVTFGPARRDDTRVQLGVPVGAFKLPEEALAGWINCGAPKLGTYSNPTARDLPYGHLELKKELFVGTPAATPELPVIAVVDQMIVPENSPCEKLPEFHNEMYRVDTSVWFHLECGGNEIERPGYSKMWPSPGRSIMGYARAVKSSLRFFAARMAETDVELPPGCGQP